MHSTLLGCVCGLPLKALMTPEHLQENVFFVLQVGQLLADVRMRLLQRLPLRVERAGQSLNDAAQGTTFQRSYPSSNAPPSWATMVTASLPEPLPGGGTRRTQGMECGPALHVRLLRSAVCTLSTYRCCYFLRIGYSGGVGSGGGRLGRLLGHGGRRRRGAAPCSRLGEESIAQG